MLNSLYVSATGMLSEIRRQDVVANNLANATTTGFKRDIAITSEYDLVFANLSTDRNQSVSATRVAPIVGDSITDFAVGSFTETGQPLDIALAGEGFFSIQTDQGTRYTRNGDFHLTAEGTLANTAGQAVLDSAGNPITLSGEDVTINSLGQISEGGTVVASIGVTQFTDPSQLIKEGANLFTLAAGATTEATIPGQVRQGFLEAANTSAIKEMVAMIEIQRAYEANQRMIHTIDQTLDQAINKVGRS